MLLQNAVKFNLTDFQDVWQQSVPEGMSTRLDQLKVRGHLLIERLKITIAHNEKAFSCHIVLSLHCILVHLT